MKIYILFFLILTGNLFAQTIDLRGSMGINFMAAPSLRDYLNQNYRTGAEYAYFNSAINFSVETNYYVTEKFAAGIEAAYVFNSYNYTEIGRKELTTAYLMPSFTAYYVLSGTGYNFKFGGGAGPRLVYITETQFNTDTEYSSTGIGFLLKADGNTLLDGNLYANIGADLRYDVNGSFTSVRKVDLDSFSAGIRLGLTYIIF
jgi:hypothetical protein